MICNLLTLNHPLQYLALKQQCRGRPDQSAALLLEMGMCKRSDNPFSRVKTEPNPDTVYVNATVDPRSCDRRETGYVCDGSSPLHRIGYMSHWGVQGAPYHHTMPTHRTPGDTEDSRTNILNAIKEWHRRLESAHGQTGVDRLIDLFVYLMI